MLVGTARTGLIVFPKGTLTGRILPLNNQGKMVPDYNVKALLSGREGQIWLYVNNIGICRFEPVAGSIVIKHKDTINANCLAPGLNDTLLAGTDNALYRYDSKSSNLVPYKLQNGNLLRPGRIMSLCADQGNRLWIATDGK